MVKPQMQKRNVPLDFFSWHCYAKVPEKIMDNFLGLCNIVAYIQTAEKDGTKHWYYHLEGSPILYAKDQILCRKNCWPEDIFSGKEVAE